MNKLALRLGLSLAAIALMSCSGDDPRYSTFSDETGTFRMNETTGEIHQVLDGKLVKITEDIPTDNESLSQAVVIEDFEIAIRFLDGNYETSAGEFGILECVQSKPIDAPLSINRTRAELADALVACMDEKQWFEAERPDPEPTDSSIPACEEGKKEYDDGNTICMSQNSDCDHKEYWGKGMFICESDDE